MLPVTPAASAPAVCGSCAGTRVTAIAMALADGSTVDFTSCRRCEARSWTQAGRALDLATVLGKAAVPARPARASRPRPAP